MAEKKAKELSFEEKEEKLGQIIKKLEDNPSLSLKETTALYSEGKELLKSMNEELNTLKGMVTNEIVKE